MRLTPTNIKDLIVVESEPRHDPRGYFHRLFDAEIFETENISFTPRQSGVSHNARAGTLRGMHYQRDPSEQAKLVRCLRGSLFDVAIDLRPQSTTYCHWFGIELRSDNHLALFVPNGFAHGFLTLQDNTDVLYEISHPENLTDAAGVRWNDPAFKVAWPAEPQIINERDANYSDYLPGPVLD